MLWNHAIQVVTTYSGFKMVLSIKNSRAKELAVAVSRETGETITQAVIKALEERLERIRGSKSLPDTVESIMHEYRYPHMVQEYYVARVAEVSADREYAIDFCTRSVKLTAELTGKIPSRTAPGGIRAAMRRLKRP